MRYIELSELNQIANTMSNRSKDIDIEFCLFITFNRNYGFRYNELKQVARWTINENNTLTCKTEKGSNPRTIYKSEIPDLMFYSIEHNEELFPTLRKSTFIRVFNSFCPVNGLHVGTKKIESHFYRHLLVKNLFALGKSLTDISLFIGEVSETNTAGYLNSLIWTY